MHEDEDIQVSISSMVIDLSTVEDQILQPQRSCMKIGDTVKNSPLRVLDMELKSPPKKYSSTRLLKTDLNGTTAKTSPKRASSNDNAIQKMRNSRQSLRSQLQRSHSTGNLHSHDDVDQWSHHGRELIDPNKNGSGQRDRYSSFDDDSSIASSEGDFHLFSSLSDYGENYEALLMRQEPAQHIRRIQRKQSSQTKEHTFSKNLNGAHIQSMHESHHHHHRPVQRSRSCEEPSCFRPHGRSQLSQTGSHGNLCLDPHSDHPKMKQRRRIEVQKASSQRQLFAETHEQNETFSQSSSTNGSRRRPGMRKAHSHSDLFEEPLSGDISSKPHSFKIRRPMLRKKSNLSPSTQTPHKESRSLKQQATLGKGHFSQGDLCPQSRSRMSHGKLDISSRIEGTSIPVKAGVNASWENRGSTKRTTGKVPRKPGQQLGRANGKNEDDDKQGTHRRNCVTAFNLNHATHAVDKDNDNHKVQPFSDDTLRREILRMRLDRLGLK